MLLVTKGMRRYPGHIGTDAKGEALSLGDTGSAAL